MGRKKSERKTKINGKKEKEKTVTREKTKATCGYKFLPRQRAVEFWGFDMFPIPECVEKTLEAYGFEEDTGVRYTDRLEGEEASYLFETYAGLMPVALKANRVVNKRGARSSYQVILDQTHGKEASTVHEAYLNAFKTWNRAGRPILGVRFEDALRTAFSGAGLNDSPC